MRGFFVAFFIVLGGILVIPASLAVWQEREILDEDNFVATMNEVFQDEDVQVAIATRLTATIMEEGDISGRIESGLGEVQARNERVPEGILLLKGPLTNVAEEAIYRLTIRALESPRLQAALDAALRAAHRTLMAILDEDNELLQVEDGVLYLDLQPVVEEVIVELAGERGLDLLEKIEIPDDAGKIEITAASDNEAIWTLARWVDKFDPVLPIMSAAFFVLAIAIARRRSRAVIGVGTAIAVVSALALFTIAVPLKELATSWPPREEGVAAAESTYEILVDSFRSQQLFLVIVGIAMVGGGFLGGDTEFMRTLRTKVRGKPGEGPTLREWAIERVHVLRLVGLGLGALFILVWPDPSTRLTVTVLVIIGLYLVAVTALTSEAEWAKRVREKANELLGAAKQPVESGVPRSGTGMWVERHSGLLRLIGLVAAIILLAAWPNFTFGTFFVVSALTLMYLAAIDWLSNRAD
jgi:hypothetical protein